MSIVITIPARLNSKRIKHKMLLDFDGEPLIRHVFDRVVTMGYDTFVLTDSKKIAKHIPSDNVIFTKKANNGTERIASVVDQFDGKYNKIINVQGDLIDVTRDLVIKIIEQLDIEEVVTAYTTNPTSVKIIHNGYRANWFTRKDLGYGDYHIGIYGYNLDALYYYRDSKQSIEEKIEDLEQLRFLKEFDIGVVHYDYDGREINTKDDL